MNLALQVAQCLLAVVFLGSGTAKSIQSKDRMIATGQTGVAPFPLPVIRVVAACEIAGAVGVLLPWALDVAPVLTPIAAVGLAVVMVGAAASHASLKEYKQVLGVNLVLFLLCVFVAVGRSG